MEFKIDNDTIKEAATSAVQSAIARGLDDWKLQQAIAEAATAAISEVNLPALVAVEVRRVLDESAAAVVAEAVVGALPAITAGITEQIRQTSVAMVAGLLTGKPDNYDAAGRRRWQKAEAIVSEREE